MLALAFALLWLAPVAHAAAPGNDDFANAESLGIGLPVDITRSNVEATTESEEPVHGMGATAQSVWFTWEAEVSGFVSIGVCDSEFQAMVTVYTGAAFNSLAKAVYGSENEGPDCSFSQREFTFEVVGGTSYKIAVTGNGSYLPPAPPPVTSGEFDLRIRATPPPPNDDFQDATTLTGQISEAPNGNRSYAASMFGYNWLATKETGEPDHGPDEGGASVWYSWTAPGSGRVTVHACCALVRSVALYEGALVNALTPVERTPSPPFEGFTVTGGTTYRLAVDGRFDSGEVNTGSFNLMLSMALPPKPTVVVDGFGLIETSTSTLISSPPDAAAVRDVDAPQTSVSKRMLKRTPPVVALDFSSSEPGSTFRCKLDKRAYSACRSPRRLKNLSPGRHTFRVVATDAAGNADPTPAKVSFRIPEPSGSAAGAAGRR